MLECLRKGVEVADGKRKSFACYFVKIDKQCLMKNIKTTTFSCELLLLPGSFSPGGVCVAPTISLHAGVIFTLAEKNVHLAPDCTGSVDVTFQAVSRVLMLNVHHPWDVAPEPCDSANSPMP